MSPLGDIEIQLASFTTPDGVNDRVTTLANTSITIKVLTNDSDGDRLELEGFSNSSNGSVRLENNGTPNNRIDDQLVYAPDSDFTGNDSFTYSISDGLGGMDTGIVQGMQVTIC